MEYIAQLVVRSGYYMYIIQHRPKLSIAPGSTQPDLLCQESRNGLLRIEPTLGNTHFK